MRLLIILCATLLATACTSMNGQYLDEAKGNTTQEEILKKWGEPTVKQKLETGEMIWRYRYRRFSSVQSREICSEYELRFDDDRILKKWYPKELYCEGIEIRGLLCPGPLRTSSCTLPPSPS